MKLEPGQVAVVTGAASGIGFALAERFARLGLGVVLADVEPGPLATAVAQIDAEPGAVMPIPTDVSRAADVDALAAATIDHFGRVDIVCNNAGVNLHRSAMWQLHPLDWQWVLGVNLWGVIHGIRSFVPRFVAAGHGHIVNTASMAGLTVLPFIGPYAASKHAVVGISEALRAELDEVAPKVGVTILCPGYVPTNLATSARNRPAEVTPPADEGARTAGDFDRSRFRPLAAADVAAQVTAAIEADRLYVLSHPGSEDRVQERFARVLERA
jgi:NAD(P)-dependent dehydrogenase (short-subunit alcohol dehydrogenase family)